VLRTLRAELQVSPAKILTAHYPGVCNRPVVGFLVPGWIVCRQAAVAATIDRSMLCAELLKPAASCVSEATTTLMVFSTSSKLCATSSPSGEQEIGDDRYNDETDQSSGTSRGDGSAPPRVLKRLLLLLLYSCLLTLPRLLLRLLSSLRTLLPGWHSYLPVLCRSGHP